MSGRELGAVIAATAGLATAVGAVFKEQRELTACEANHHELMEVHARVIMTLVQEGDRDGG